MTVDDLPQPLEALLNADVPPSRLSPVDVEMLGAECPAAWGPADVAYLRRDDGVELAYFRLVDLDGTEHYLDRGAFRQRMGWAP